jgi:hypothetical protein
MSLITDAVAKFEEMTFGSGCADCMVDLKRQPDAPVCRYVRGVNLEARFGGKSAQVVSRYPVETTTRPAFMFGRELATPEQRTAALGIINAVMGFLCLVRGTRACGPESHDPCFAALRDEIGCSPVYCNGSMPYLEQHFAAIRVDDPGAAEIILSNEDGLIGAEGLAVLERYGREKRLIFLGPATAGIATLRDAGHWCPFGR